MIEPAYTRKILSPILFCFVALNLSSISSSIEAVSLPELHPFIGESVPEYSVIFDDSAEFGAKLVENESPAVSTPSAAAAWGRYWETYNSTGYSVLDVHTNPHLSTNEQSFAAGFIEGALTHRRMYEYTRNVWDIDFNTLKVKVKDKDGSIIEKENEWKLPPTVENFLKENLRWMEENSEKADESEHDRTATIGYWRLAGGLRSQLMGLTAGFNYGQKRDGNNVLFSELQIYSLSLIDTDMEDILKKIALDSESSNNSDFAYYNRENSPDHIGQTKVIPNKGEFFRRWENRLQGIRDGLVDRESIEEALTQVKELEADQSKRHKERKATRKQKRGFFRAKGHCSAAVALTKDHSDIFLTHAEWDSYVANLKVVKFLDMPLPDAKVRKLAYTGNFGGLYSGEDFYKTSANLAIVETTLENDNSYLVKEYVKPESMLTWARPMLANRLALNGEEWTRIDSHFQSGTNNNGWLVVDYNVFKKMKDMRKDDKDYGKGLLWTIETMPGYKRRADVSKILIEDLNGLWAGFNIPYFRKLRLISDETESGVLEALVQNNESSLSDKESLIRSAVLSFGYKTCPRCRMFEEIRKNGGVQSLAEVFALIRRNEFPHEKFGQDNACNAIASRCDLNPKDSSDYNCFGETNAKAVRAPRDESDVNDLEFFAILGPSTGGFPRGNLPFFKWSEQNASVDKCSQAVGMPDVLDYPWWTFKDSRSKLLRVATSTTSSSNYFFNELENFLVPGIFLVMSSILFIAVWLSRSVQSRVISDGFSNDCYFELPE